MKKVLSFSLVLALIISSFAFALTPAQEAGAELKKIGLINGDSAGNLNEDQDLTREQAVATLVRMMGKSKEAAAMPAKQEFDDVKADHWAAKDLAYAKKQGWTKGIDEKNFGVGQNVTLQQYATFMLRALGQDDDKVYAEAIKRATDAEILEDMSKDKAAAEIKRGDAFVMMLNTLLANVKDSDQSLAAKLGLANKMSMSKDSDSASASSVAKTVYPLTVTDGTDRQVTIDKAPTKVVCLYGSYADLWDGAEGKLAGVIKSKNLEGRFTEAKLIGTIGKPNVEAILALEPDLVILSSKVSKQKALTSILDSSNIPYYDARCESLEETDKLFKDFCAILDHNDVYQNKMIPMIADINKLKAQKKDFTYLLLFSSAKSIKTKDDNIAAEIIDNLGGKNITKDYKIADEESKQFSFEKILEANPDYIFIQTMGDVEKAKSRLEKDIYANAAWSSLTAVKEKRLYYLPKDLFMFKPNLKYADAYQYMLDILEGKISSEPESK